jgi:hypothetical protein
VPQPFLEHIERNAFGALLKPPVISGLTESQNHLSPTEWQTILAKLRRARLLAAEDPQNPGQLDTHPLVREYFGEKAPESTGGRLERKQ